MSKFYLTTPIYYANAAPHLGHAYTTLLADAIARQRRLAGDDVFFLTGTDEHGDKIEETAKKRGMTPQALVDESAGRFRALWRELDVTHTDFLRTTEARHRTAVRDVLARLHRGGHFYAAEYEGWFCTPCERFWTDKEVARREGTEICPNPDCARPIVRLAERNYFFRMGRHQSWLLDQIRAHPEFIQPEIRRNEVLGFLSKPLGDLCISRPRARVGWGIPLPFDENYVTYVWFDALLNYVTAIGYPFDMRRFAAWWPADLQLIGKEIVTTHCIYWPAMLNALELPLPRTILAHGWWLFGGEKMSKSRGNVVDPMAVLAKHGGDAFRYYLLREMAPGQDASFTEERFRAVYNAELANTLGNLLSRTVTMIVKYAAGRLPARSAAESDFARAIREEALPEWAALLARDRPGETIARLVADADLANGWIEVRKPWALAKAPASQAELTATLYDLAEFLRLASRLAEPFFPRTVLQWRETLGLGREAGPLEWGKLPEGLPVRPGPPLFPRIE